MNFISKTVCATLFILSYCSFLQAQISLDKIAYQTNSNLVEELHFQYDNGLISHMDAFSESDTSHLSIEYENGEYSAIHRISTNSHQDNFSLSFRYNNNQLDSIFFVDDYNIGLYVFNYNQEDAITLIETFVNIDGTLFHSNSLNFQYSDGKCIQKEWTKYFNKSQDDYYKDMDHFNFNSSQEMESINHFFDGSVGHAKSYINYSNANEKEVLTQVFDGSNEIVSEQKMELKYSATYSNSDIKSPFVLFDLLWNIDRFSFDALLNPTIILGTNALLEINKNDIHFCKLYYSDPLVSDIEELDHEQATTIIYPNPVRDYLNFTEAFSPEFVSIFDIQGRLVCKMNFLHTNVNLSNLENGNYLLQATDTKGESISIQFVKI